MRKTIFFLIIASAVLFHNCKSDSNDSSAADGSVTKLPDASIMNKYFTEHTTGYVSVKDGFLFRLNDDFADSRSEVNGVKTKPDIDGTWKWESDNTLSFRPKEPLDYDKSYGVYLQLNDLLGSNEHPNDPLYFQFKTKKLKFSIQIDGLKINQTANGDHLSLQGEITSADYADPNSIESLLSASQKGHQPLISWTHNNSGKSHQFTISDIEQLENKTSELNLNWTGKKWDKSFQGKKTILISSIEEFKLADVRVSSSPDKLIRLFFSRPLDPSQNLQGLININGSYQGIKTTIENNVIIVYPNSETNGDFVISVSDKIQSSTNQKLSKSFSENLQFGYSKPSIRLVDKGIIIPNTSESYLPIEVINLKALDIEIFKIYENNVLQYLQSNNLNGSYNLAQVGNIIHREKLEIEDGGSKENHNKWIRIGLNLKDYINQDPASLYQIRIGFQKGYAITDCEKEENAEVIKRSGEQSLISFSDGYYNDWNERDNPCHRAFYNPNRFLQHNVILSDLGIIAKQGGNNNYHIVANSIASGATINGATITFYDFQQQRITEGNSNGSGFLSIRLERPASFIVAQKGNDYAYLKLNDENSNSLTDFEIGGQSLSTGIDGFIYTDRGVHRPGDTIYLNFMLDEKKEALPNEHPVTMEVKDPKGNRKFKTTTSDHVHRIYSFEIPTDQNDLTGQWRATIKVGPHQFSKSLRIETIKPNRLKIEVDTDQEISYSNAENRKISLSSRWLHGASANGLKAKVEASYGNRKPNFNYSEYSFMDPAREGNTGLQVLFDGKLNEDGKAEIPLKLKTDQFPGKIDMNVNTRVFENGGNYSENYTSVVVSPFDTYVGVKSPKSRWGYKSVKIGDQETFQVISVNEDGKAVANRKLNVGIYDIDWQWWYYQSDRYNIYRLSSSQHKEAKQKQSITTNAKGEADLVIDFQDFEYGRKMIRICDEESGHCTGDFFYARGWGRSNVEEERESLAKLNFKSDKSSYKTGEQVSIKIPSEEGSQILISLETGNDVIFKEWIQGKNGETEYTFTTNESMTPTVYIHAIMVQSYDDKENDLPLRMYGVVPIEVTNEKSILEPSISVASSLEPQANFEVEVSEKSGRPMAYTIAIVDEGLLDLTNFNTPDPHKHFFAKQALGVKTWDLFDHVLTGINGSVDKMITVGGDDDGKGQKGAKKAIRFKPVVMTAGPFYIHNGESQSHNFKMPNYLGSVRAMVISKMDQSYGHSEKTIPVKKDIMILPTLPRVVGPEEEITIPVSVFVNNDQIRNVDVRIESSPNIEIISSAEQRIRFSKADEKLVFFKGVVKSDLGLAKLKISASNGKIDVSQDLEIDIRNPNPFESEVYDNTLEPGQTWETNLSLVGMPGTNEAIVELSSVPPMNLEERLEYLTSYPYGCVEQTVSAAFPQLFLDNVIDVDFNREKLIHKNINAGIRRLSKLQNSNGSMAYWPGGRTVSKWGTSYAGHFLVKAKEMGYFVSNDMLENWKQYQQRTARNFRIDRSKKRWHQRWQMKDQAYRLFTLAIHGDPELPSMNILKKEIDLPLIAQYLLAGAYAYSGKTQIASDMIRNKSMEVQEYKELAYTYGSDVRDMAIIAQTLMKLERDQDAGKVIKKIASQLSSQKWYSTQTLAHALAAVSEFVADYGRDDINVKFDIGNSGEQEVTTKKPVYLYAFDPDKESNLSSSIQNNSKGVLFARITMSGQQSPDKILESESYNRNIDLSINYKDLNGNAIDPSELKRGTDFVAHIRIDNQNSRGALLEEMALSQIFPSGWEIQSGGLNNLDQSLKEDSYEYRDKRDDRIYTFFDLKKKKDFKIMLTAAYDGTYFLPPVVCEAMYDNEIRAKTKGMVVKVVAPE